MYRPTKLSVDFDALTGNLAKLRAARPGKAACCVIKADGYGHGALPVGRALKAAGAEAIAVALVEEALELRSAGLEGPLIVLASAFDGGYETMVEHELTPVIYREDQLEALAAAATRLGKSATYHLKLDSGMERVGLHPAELGAFLGRAQKCEPAARLDGFLTHLANADLADEAMNKRQLDAFLTAINALGAAGFQPTFLHIANSAATLTFPKSIDTHIRPGLALFGIAPFAQCEVALVPVARWTTKPVHLKTVPKGTAVSYGGRWIAPRESRIATLPVGYADGYPRLLSNRASVLIRGARAPIVGSVCMDLSMVDVTDIPGVELGDEVVLMGSQGDDEISANELARHAETISYEIVCGIQKRVPRHYTGEFAKEIAP